jgi:hypothetical protein
MKSRDLEIINSLELYKCLTRDQIAALHFSTKARPHINANQVLRRLRDRGYILANTDKSFQQYTYFNNPSPIKMDSQKIDHHLLINQTVIDMLKHAPIQEFKLETKLDDTDLIPDIQVKGWLNNNWFIECENTLHGTKQLYSKINKYKEYYENGYWNNERVLIIGKINMKLETDDYSFKIMQIKCIDDLKDTIQRYKELKFKEFKGKVKEETKTVVSNDNEVSRVIKNGNKQIKFIPKSG